MSLWSRLLTLKDFFPIIGPTIGALIVAGTTASVAIVVTQHLTAATKRTEFFLEFTKRYANIIAEKHKLDTRIIAARQGNRQYQSNELDQADAHQVFFQLFSLIYDEFYAYQNNFLEPKVFVDWMIWQWHDAKETEFGGVSYRDGLKRWFEIPAAQSHPVTPIIDGIYKCPDEECIRRVVMRYAP